MVAFPATAADVSAAVRVCARFGVPITARGGGTSQAGQSIGAGVILDGSKHLDRIIEINAQERWARVQPGCVLDDLNRGAQAPRVALRPGHLHLEPGDHRRHDRQQFLGRALGLLRQDDRSRARAGRRALRRQPRAPGADRRVRGRIPMCPRRTSKARATASRDGWRPSTPTRSTADSRRSSGASGATTSTSSCRGGSGPAGVRSALQPGPDVHRLGGDAGPGGRGEAEPRRAAPRPVDDGRRVRRPARGPGGDADDPAAPAGGRRGRGQIRAGQHPAQSRGDPAPRLPPGRSRGRSC